MKCILALCLTAFLTATGSANAQDAEALRQQGREARQSGQFDRALQSIQEAVKLQPDNADIQLELGLALMGLMRFDEAQAALRRTLDLAPNYVDAKLALARIAYFTGDLSEARSIAEALLAEQPNEAASELITRLDAAIAAQKAKANQIALPSRKPAPTKAEAKPAAPAAPRLKRSIANPPERPATSPKPIATKRWRLDTSAYRARLSGNRPEWRELHNRLAYSLSPGTIIAGSVQMASRYKIADSYVEARVDHQLLPGFSVFLRGGGTPSADYLPKWAIGGGGAARLYQKKGAISATVLTLELRDAHYVSGPVRTISPGFEQYFFDGKLWLTGRWIHLINEAREHHQGYLIRADALFNDDLRIFIGYANAPETSDGLTFDTRSLFGGIVVGLNDQIDLTVSAAHERRVGLFDLMSITAGIAYKF